MKCSLVLNGQGAGYCTGPLPYKGLSALRRVAGSGWRAGHFQFAVCNEETPIEAPFASFSRPAHAKLNLRLEVGPLAGRLHTIVSVIAELDIADQLSFSYAPDGFAVECDPPEIAERDNLVWLAIEQLGRPLPPVRISLVKNIPMEGGLGGGSADAGAALLGIGEVCSAMGDPLGSDAIGEAAAKTGSDVPSSLVPGLKLVSGTGEMVTPFPSMAPPWGIVLLKPRAGSATGKAYALLDRSPDRRQIDDGTFERAREMCRAFAAHEFDEVVGLLHNDFAAVMEGELPDIALARRRLSGAGAAATILCGSGSCVAGFFRSMSDAEGAQTRCAVSAGEWLCVTRFHA